MNSKQLQAKLADAAGWAADLAKSPDSDEGIVDDIYLTALSRPPAAEEKTVALAYFKTEGATRQTAIEDIVWALVNSAEFVFNH